MCGRDWSSDVCSSDLGLAKLSNGLLVARGGNGISVHDLSIGDGRSGIEDRKSVV